MFTAHRFLFCSSSVAATSSTRNLLLRSGSVPAHVLEAARPLSEQVGASHAASAGGGGAFTSPVGGRHASSLLQDWVMLAHKRPIRDTSSELSPELNVKWDGFSPEQISLIGTALQLREWDIHSSRAKRLRKQIAVSTTPSPAAAAAAASAARTASAATPAGPRTVQRVKPRAVSPASSSSSSSTSPSSTADQPVEADAAHQQQQAVPPPLAPAAPRLRAKVLLRKDGGDSAAATFDESPSSAAGVKQQDASSSASASTPTAVTTTTTTTTTTQRRKVVRVGVASRPQ